MTTKVDVMERLHEAATRNPPKSRRKSASSVSSGKTRVTKQKDLTPATDTSLGGRKKRDTSNTTLRTPATQNSLTDRKIDMTEKKPSTSVSQADTGTTKPRTLQTRSAPGVRNLDPYMRAAMDAAVHFEMMQDVRMHAENRVTARAKDEGWFTGAEKYDGTRTVDKKAFVDHVKSRPGGDPNVKIVESWELSLGYEKDAERSLVKDTFPFTIWPEWVDSRVGAGALSLMRFLACVGGDPSWRFDLGRERKFSELKSYVGLVNGLVGADGKFVTIGFEDTNRIILARSGEPGRAVRNWTGVQPRFSKPAKTRLYIMTLSLAKMNKKGHFRLVYEEAKAEALTRTHTTPCMPPMRKATAMGAGTGYCKTHPGGKGVEARAQVGDPIGPGHADQMAMRKTMEAVLLDLWEFARSKG